MILLQPNLICWWIIINPVAQWAYCIQGLLGLLAWSQWRFKISINVCPNVFKNVEPFFNQAESEQQELDIRRHWRHGCTCPESVVTEQFLSQWPYFPTRYSAHNSDLCPLRHRGKAMSLTSACNTAAGKSRPGFGGTAAWMEIYIQHYIYTSKQCSCL